MDQMIREAIETLLHLNNMNMEDGLCLSRSWKPLIHTLKGHRKRPIQHFQYRPGHWPPHCPFQDTTRPRPVPYLLSSISHVIPSIFSHIFPSLSSSSCPPALPYVRWSTCWTPRALIRATSFKLSLLHVLSPPSGQAVVCPPLLLAPRPSPDPDPIPTGLVKVLPWLTGSYISNQFHVHGLLFTLLTEAAKTSEMLVNFYQTTQHYNPEDSHLPTHHCENLKSCLISTCSCLITRL
jgi:hypothetical protein